MSIFCTTDIIKDGLLVDFDLSDSNTWNENTGFTINSLTTWGLSKTSGMTLYDYGLTAYDVGRVGEMYSGITISPTDRTFKLYPAGYNNPPSGSTTNYLISGITDNTGSTVGNYLYLSGGFFQNFFKLDTYNYELLPYRFNNGFTVETILNINDNSFSNNGFFLFFGTRSEDKYLPYFSGETKVEIVQKKIVRTVSQTFSAGLSSNETIINEVEISGVYTSDNNNLTSEIDKSLVLSANTTENLDLSVVRSFPRIGRLTEDNSIDNDPDYINDNLYNNVIGFRFTENGNLGYRRINSSGEIEEKYSNDPITNSGWTVVSISFKPYEIIQDLDLLECYPIRKGDLSISINARKVLTINDFDEFYFKSLNNDKEKQIGVPYNISWGGGSFGLKHSYHWDYQTRYFYNENDQTFVDNNFSEILNPTITYDCTGQTTGFTATTNFTVTQIDDYYDECSDSTIQKTVVLVQEISGTTGTTNNYFINYDNDVELISNREYVVNLSIIDNGLFQAYGGTVTPKVYDVDYTLIGSTGYTFNNNSQIGNLQSLSLRFKTLDNTAKQLGKIGFEINSDYVLSSGFSFYFEDFYIIGQDILVQDNRKQNLTIQNYFDGSFIGGISKLKIYEKPLNIQETFHNFDVQRNQYGLLSYNGGRVIRRN